MTRRKQSTGMITGLLLVGTVATGLVAAWSTSPAAASGPIDWKEARQHWSFRPPVAKPLPAVRNKTWPRSGLDHFILSRIEAARIVPSREADPRTLIRRVTYDLTGLPPTPEEVEAFVKECEAEGALGRSSVKAVGQSPQRRNPATPTAYERLVDRLLSSPRFGERMASLWLPLARYAEDQAHQVGDDTRFFYPNAFLYREWVIEAFNRDLPYDQFLRLQLAADLYTSPAPAPPGVAAAAPAAPAAQVAAAPGAGAVPMAAVQAPPAPAPAGGTTAPAPSKDLAALGFLGLGPKYYNRERLDVMADEWQDRVDTVTRTFQGLTVACARCHDHKYDPITATDYYSLAGIFASTKMVNMGPDGKPDSADTAAKMSKATVHVVSEGAPQDLNVFVRGNVANKGPVAPRRYLEVLSEGEPAPFKAGSGRRELAETLASPRNPLTARVMVNRLWGMLFGMPLVGTPSNFGLIGDRPSDPELLDWLAVRFMNGAPGAQPWSMKSMIREMVLSSTYRQTSSSGLPVADSGPSKGSKAVSVSASGKSKPTAGRKPNPQSAILNPQSVDPTNRLFWRMNRRRMTIEQWRDSVLAVTAQLEAGGGPSQELTDTANRRRTVYARISRLKLNDMLIQFDYPDANVHAEKRSVTTTPMQKLFMLNSPFMLEEAHALATRLNAAASTDAERVRQAYLLLFARLPQPEETRLALEYLSKPEAEGEPRWDRYAQVLLSANEMLYVD